MGELPAACSEEAPCAQGQACAALGICVPAGLCAIDAHCPDGAPLCRATGGECVACRGEEDCAPAESCKAGKCQLFEQCLLDGDCPGSRVCQQGGCQPAPGCEGDRFDGLAQAPTLPLWDTTGLLLCDGATDRFQVELPAGVGLQVVARPEPGAQGDLRLDVLSLPAPGRTLGSSDYAWGPERVALPVAAEARTVALVVAGRPGVSIPYRLQIDPLGPEDCAPDTGEGLWNNDTPERATPLPNYATRTLSLCAGDTDWLAVELAVGLRTLVTARSTAGAQDLVLAVYADPLAAPLQETAPGAAPALDYTATSSGRHYVRLTSASDQTAAVELSLQVQAAEDALALACAAPVDLAVDEALALPDAPQINRFQLSCRQGMGADHVLRFELQQPGRVWVDVGGVQMGSALSLRADCVDGPELLCAWMQPGEPSPPVALPPGVYHLLLKTDGPQEPSVHLHMSAGCVADAGCPPGEFCQGALCLAACEDDQQCGPAQTCDGESGRCLEPERCSDDAECVGLRQCDPLGACFMPECQIDADCEGACVDQRCAEGPPVACAADGDCPPSSVCAEAGVCVRTQRCVQDADCGLGAALCHAPSGECRTCIADGDCAPSESCWQGRCSYVGLCDGPDDCPGDRTCDEAGSCVPASCVDDRLEELPQPAPLVARTYTGLVLCDGDQDRYAVRAEPGRGLLATLRHEPAAGDLVLELRSGEGGGELLDVSDGRWGAEVLGVPAAGEAQLLQLVVTGRAGRSVPYTISVTDLAPEQCPPDGQEGPLGNDTLADAAAVGTGTRWLRVCPGDEDWLRVTLPAGARLRARARTQAAVAALALELYGPDEELFASGQHEDLDPEQPALPAAVSLQADATQAGTYSLRVHAPGAVEPIWLLLGLAAEPAPNATVLACEQVPELVVGVPALLPDAISVDRFDTGCALGQGEEHLVTFVLDAPGAVTLQVRGNRNPVGIALRSSCNAPGTEVACGLDMDTPLQNVLLEAGQWTAIVETRGESEPELLLGVVR